MKQEPRAIEFNNPFVIGRELEYIARAVAGGHLAGNGRYTRRCEAWMERRYGAPRVLLTHSCTGALEMCALLAGIEPGDEVILPSFAFVSTANAFVLRGARPRFVDIRPDTLNLDERQLPSAVGSRSRVVVPLHYAGVGCAMEEILAFARRRRLLVVEDAAQGVEATYRGRPLGTFGHLGAYSFHETKNIISGEGGALVINDPRFIDRAEILLEKGTNRRRFYRGEVDKYTWVDLGSSYLPSDMVAAFLFAQFEKAAAIDRRRRAIFERYREGLQPLAERGLVRLPVVPPECRHNGHLFYLLVMDGGRDRLLAHLRRHRIHAVFHYVPLHTSPMGRRFGYRPGDFPVSEFAGEHLARLPCFFALTEADQARVIAEVHRFFGVACAGGTRARRGAGRRTR